jgi:hypothetical protein
MLLAGTASARQQVDADRRAVHAMAPSPRPAVLPLRKGRSYKGCPELVMPRGVLLGLAADPQHPGVPGAMGEVPCSRTGKQDNPSSNAGQPPITGGQTPIGPRNWAITWNLTAARVRGCTYGSTCGTPHGFNTCACV